ncbi:Protein of unknown function DUF2870 [Carpediemonas membranifera]|uniref:Uncharacterized protein n=1 Tax=Carpediemonas membranifera TaxID=201153 RepID=A0A8J6B511_9EUKA|nr:Protein of unknown function DUF2870 [Carpediemonas membranifera]|eukprot:KAG9390177.1 Protein of unknown function DUF2870 [Carpediemonas membranifera]
MTKIHFKKSDEHQFMIETTNSTLVDTLNEQLCAMHNERIVLLHLTEYIDQFRQYGVAVPEEQRCIDIPIDEDEHKSCPGTIYHADPNKLRNGFAPGEEVGRQLAEAIADVKNVLDKQNPANRVFLTEEQLSECHHKLNGALMIALATHYPKYVDTGLPEYDEIQRALSLPAKEALAEKQAGKELLDPKETELWFAGKRMEGNQGKKLADYFGRNEKMKVLVKPSKNGRPPVAEQQSEAQRRDMMSFYYKQQQEYERMDAEDGVESVSAPWARGGLKSSIHGMGGIKWR